MSFFSSKSRQKPPQPSWDQFSKEIAPSIVRGIRRIAAARRCPPGLDVSDAEIVEIFLKVGTAFNDAANSRAEKLLPNIRTNIAFFFLQKHHVFGKKNPTFFDEHIAYEAEKYRNYGLRPEYNRPLCLDYTEPLWHVAFTPEFGLESEVLITRLEERREVERLDDANFYSALVRTSFMTKKRVLIIYEFLKRKMQNCSEQKYLSMTLNHWLTDKIAALPENVCPRRLESFLKEAESDMGNLSSIDSVVDIAVMLEREYETYIDDSGLILKLNEILESFYSESC